MRRAALALAAYVPFSVAAQSEAAQPEAATTRFDEIVTVASRVPQERRELATAVTVISGREIVERGYPGLTDLLRTQASIGVSNAGGPGKISALRIRGEEHYRTLVRIDGIDVSDPSSPQIAPHVEHLLATREIDRVEVLRGAQGFSYGADSGGVVNVLSRRGEGAVDGHLALERGADDFSRIDAGFSGGSGGIDYLLFVGKIETDGFNAHEDDAAPADDDGYDNTTWHTKLGWSANEQLRLELVGRGVDARNDYDRCGFPTTDDCTGELEQASYRLAADWSTTALGSTFALSGTSTDRSDLAGGQSEFATAGKLRRFEYSGSLTLRPAAAFVFGADLAREDVLPEGGERLERKQDAVFAEYRGRFFGNLHLSLGTRRDESEGFGKHDSVRAAAAYVDERAGGASVKYRASYGTGFRAPSLSEIAYNAGPFAGPPAATTVLSEESSRGLDLGVELLTVSGAYYEIGLFEQSIGDEIFFDLEHFSGYLQGSGRSESRGVELSFELPVGARWSVAGNALFNDAETVDGFARIRRPRRMANLGMRYQAPGGAWRLRANLRRSEGAIDELFGVGRVPLADYSVLDLAGSYAIDERIELFGRVQNLLDETYQELAGFNTAGASLFVGLRVGLD